MPYRGGVRVTDRPLGLAILGSTGSIGTQALDVVRANAGAYRILALAAGRNAPALAAPAAAAAMPDVDIVLNAVVGFAGLPATVAALEAGKRLALANKESLIAAGPVVARARAAGGGEIVPVDSEHSAVYQALQAGPREAVRRI